MQKRTIIAITILIMATTLLAMAGCKKKEYPKEELQQTPAPPPVVQEEVKPTPEPTPIPSPTVKPTKPQKEEKPSSSQHYHSFTVQDCTHPSVCSKCGMKGAEPLGHLWVEATCTTARTCARCKVTEGEAKGHIWKEATCTNPQICTKCGAIYGTALGHTGGVATCTEKAKCTRCNQHYGEVKAHTPIEGVTCTKDSICKDCKQVIQKATGHTWEEADCKNPKRCKVCKATEGTPTEHKFDEWQITKEVTCEEDGIRSRKCTACNLTETEPIKTKGHSWVEADCETPKHCSVCELTEGEALGHKVPQTVECGTYPVCERCKATLPDKVEHEWKNGSCTEPSVCTRCGAKGAEPIGHYGGKPTCQEPGICEACKTEYLPKTDHKWIDATCTKPKHCEFCGLEEGATIEHKWVEATCAKPKHCSVCGKEDGVALPHRLSEPSCQVDQHCLDCGYIAEHTKIDHKMSDWAIIQEKTCTQDEIKQKKCATCDFTIEEKAAASGHTWTDATCETPKQCSVCNATEGEPLGHRGGEATTTSKAKCEVCGKEYGEVLPIEAMYTVYDLNTGTEVTDTLENLVAQIVQNEMGGAFHEEALKAQAVAARSWLMYQNKGRTAFFAMDQEKTTRSMYPEVGLRKPNKASTAAAQSTKNECLTYNGAVALTPYFACSNGWTQGSQEAWNSRIPYLVAVESKYDNEATSYKRKTEIPKDNLKFILSEYIDGLEYDKYLEKDWVEIISKTTGNYNDLMRVCGITKYTSKISGRPITIKGRTIRSILDLASPDFTVEYNAATDKFIFTTYGWGHGCGMSQWGAHLYAVKDGMTYTDILNHYFPGTQAEIRP